jgi:hypothetical protein
MGLAVAGIVFQRQSGVFDTDKIISSLFSGNFKHLDQLNSEFDTRNDDYVSIEIIGNTCFIYSTLLATPFVFNGSEDISEIYNALEKPELILAYCNFDSGGSYGYVFFEHGKKTRRRLFSNEQLTEEGSPKQFEIEWLNAETYIENPNDPPEEHQKIYFKNNHEIEVSEYSLTWRLLYETLEKYFGVYPWEEDLPNSKKFYYSKVIAGATSFGEKTSVKQKNQTGKINFIIPSAFGAACTCLAWVIYRRRKAALTNHSSETPNGAP